MRQGRWADRQSHSHTLSFCWVAYPWRYALYVFMCWKMWGCCIRYMYWIYLTSAKFSCTFGGEMLHWLRSFITAEASALARNSEPEPQQWRENPQLIKHTITLSWKVYLWEHCCQTCPWPAARHHNAMHPSIRAVYSSPISPQLEPTFVKIMMDNKEFIRGEQSHKCRRHMWESWFLCSSSVTATHELWLSLLSYEAHIVSGPWERNPTDVNLETGRSPAQI